MHLKHVDVPKNLPSRESLWVVNWVLWVIWWYSISPISLLLFFLCFSNFSFVLFASVAASKTLQ